MFSVWKMNGIQSAEATLHGRIKAKHQPPGIFVKKLITRKTKDNHENLLIPNNDKRYFCYRSARMLFFYVHFNGKMIEVKLDFIKNYKFLCKPHQYVRIHERLH